MWTVTVYTLDGQIFKYTVADEATALAHVSKIVAFGYRFAQGRYVTHYPPSRLSKVMSTAPIIIDPIDPTT
jgi:hypothetical protein